MYVCVCLSFCACVCVRACVCKSVNVFEYMRVCVCLSACLSVCVCVLVRQSVRPCVHVHVHEIKREQVHLNCIKTAIFCPVQEIPAINVYRSSLRFKDNQ